MTKQYDTLTSDMDVKFYQPRNDVIFMDENNQEVGRLVLEKPMRFVGDADASAKVFFDNVLMMMAQGVRREGE